MQVERETNVVVVKMDNNEDLLGQLEELSRDQMIRSGLVLFGIGMIKDYELGYYNGTDYEFTAFEEPAELVALHGTMATVDGKPSTHLHAGVADKELTFRGGHLNKATIQGIAEIGILKLTDVELTRWRNEATGLNELLIKKASKATHHVRRDRSSRHSPGRRSMDLDLD